MSRKAKICVDYKLNYLHFLCISVVYTGHRVAEPRLERTVDEGGDFIGGLKEEPGDAIVLG